MSKKPKEPKPRVRVPDLPWNASVEGVLEQALKIHAEHRYTEVVVIGVRAKDREGLALIDTLIHTKDGFRLAGIIQWALNRLLQS